ncbi:hypothetical protein CYMTET_17809 [Cymbomonas tetramitiformis]|uniref:Ubiquitin-like domain-containing protein n=1 Tax=Cymbomonas tetramitiformis TaxID=36881 RepID=A0AAE0G9D0_9CHLO|nr:hypothetical protein CYMTET_17809 [Cymbomonas tetramitiformis]
MTKTTPNPSSDRFCVKVSNLTDEKLHLYMDARSTVSDLLAAYETAVGPRHCRRRNLLHKGWRLNRNPPTTPLAEIGIRDDTTIHEVLSQLDGPYPDVITADDLTRAFVNIAEEAQREFGESSFT